jgi:RimJ/RimL family protein N-acetyltransferase
MNLNLRLATIDDSKLLFDWANDPEVRKASFSTKSIDWKDHVEWLKKKLKRENSFLYIFQLDDIPIGMIRFDKEEENTFILSYSIASEFRGKSYSSRLITEGLSQLSKEIKQQIYVVAFVKVDNIASQKAFLKNYFCEDFVTDKKIKYIKTIKQSN